MSKKGGNKKRDCKVKIRLAASDIWKRWCLPGGGGGLEKKEQLV